MSALDNELEDFRRKWKGELLTSSQLKHHDHASTSTTTPATGPSTNRSTFSEDKCDGTPGCSSFPVTSGTYVRGLDGGDTSQGNVKNPVQIPFTDASIRNKYCSSSLEPKSGPSTDTSNASAINDASRAVGKSVYDGFSVSEAKKRKNSLKPFLIAENLLMGHSGADSFSGSQDESSTKEDYFSKNKKLRLSSDVKPSQKSERILDIFLSDLNDINEIPFFDVELPRELALKIFQYLDPRDLCRCCQVSKAWKSLAEDELLWSEICHRFGWERNTYTVDKQEWKEVVRDHVVTELHIQHNWKMRSGSFKQLEYVIGGVICAVDSCINKVVGGYSNGEVHLWDLEEEDECTFSPSSKAHTLSDLEGNIPNYVTSVALSPQFTAALYSGGNVDIWRNEGKTSAVHSVSLKMQPCLSKNLIASHSKDLFLCSFGHSLCGIYVQEDDADVSLRELTLPEEVTHMQLVPSKSTTDDVAIIGSKECVFLHKFHESISSPVVVHHAIMQTVSALNANHQILAAGLRSMCDYKIRTYDISSCKEGTTFEGLHTSVDVINLEDSPPQSFVTACSDSRICIYDTRFPLPVISLTGLKSRISCVQMDDWKVVSGSNDGLLCVWDQRMASRLWNAHNRHAVKFLRFWENYLLVGNLRPQMELFTTEDAFEGVAHRRDRGSIHLYDFRHELLREGLPDICHSNFDEPEAFNYNIRLAMPYDSI